MSKNLIPLNLILLLLGTFVTFVDCGFWQDFLPIKIKLQLPFMANPPPHKLEPKFPTDSHHKFVSQPSHTHTYVSKPEPIFEAKYPIFEAKAPIFEAKHPIFEAKSPIYEAKSQTKNRVILTNYNTPKYFKHPRFTEIHFYFKENLWGKPKHVVLRKDKCTNVPANYFLEKPRSIWASDCVMVYKKDFCWGEGVRIAGMVHELRSIGLYKGITSIKPCENNIQITFKKG